MSAKKGHIHKCRRECFYDDEGCEGEINLYSVHSFFSEGPSLGGVHFCDAHKKSHYDHTQKADPATIKTIIMLSEHGPQNDYCKFE